MSRDISNHDDTIDSRDIIERFEELEADRENAVGDVGAEQENNALAEWDQSSDGLEYAALKTLLDDIKGQGGDEQWRGDWYPITLIRDTYFVEAMQELLEDIGDIPHHMPSYLVIDWDATANNLKQDYTSVDFDGVTYWVR
jgi:hypothetical protein